MKDQTPPQETRLRDGALRRWLDLERRSADEEGCERALLEALAGWTPFSPLPGFADSILAGMASPRRTWAGTPWSHPWLWRAAVGLLAVQLALLVGLFGTAAGSLVERLGPSGVIAGLARGALLSGRSLAELTSLGQSLADASRVVGAAATTPSVLLLLAGCVAVSAVGAWLVSSQLGSGDREIVGVAP